MIARARRWAMVFCAALALSLAGSALVLADDPPPPPPCPDADGDGYVVCDGVCVPPDGTSCGDCNDSRADIRPGIDPDPIDGHGVDDNHNGQVDEGYGFCLYASDGPGEVCKTAGRQVCIYPPGPVVSVDTTGPNPGTYTCQLPPGKPVIEFHFESIAAGTCDNGVDDDCDGDMDINDSASPAGRDLRRHRQ
jgi:hypothetical protein